VTPPRIKHLTTGVRVGAMQAALAAHPELWDQNRARTEDPASPHHGLSDIWARFAAPGVDGSQPHDAIWYPAADLLPIRELAYLVMTAVRGDRLGGVLITKIPAGRECKPHSDPGWHARYYQKFAVQIHADPGQGFHFEGETLVTAPGDLFWFDNAFTHWVTNPTPHDRVTAIVCIKTDMEV
jgi:hypothetical protein